MIDRRTLIRLIALVIGIASFAVRWSLLHRFPDGDEIQMRDRFIRVPISRTFLDFDGGTNHPLYNLLARPFDDFSNPTIALRIPAFISGVLAPSVLFLLLCRRLSLIPSLISASALVFSRQHVIHSSFARGYTLAVLFLIVSCLSLTTALQTRRRRDWLIYLLASVAACYSHIWCILAVVGQGIFVVVDLVMQRMRSLKHQASIPELRPPRDCFQTTPLAALWIMGVGLLVLLVYAPMLHSILRRAQDKHPNFAPVYFRALFDMGSVGISAVGEGEFTVPFHVLVATSFLILGATGFRAASRATMLALTTFLVAAGFVYLAAPESFFARYLLFLQPIYFIAAANMLVDILTIRPHRFGWRTILAIIMIVILMPVSAAALLSTDLIDRIPFLAEVPGITLTAILLLCLAFRWQYVRSENNPLANG